MNYIGDYAEDATVYIMFNTFTSDDPSASCTITNFLNTDVHIHKDDDLTQRNNAAGITVSVNFDGITGSHMIKIDTSDDTVGGFWVINKDYFVRIEGTTIDGATINVVVGHFSIENRFKDVNVVGIEGADPTDTILGAIVDDATQIDASALNTLTGHDPGATISKAGDLMGLVADAITAAKIADNAITSDQLAASACTKIINDFETQSAIDPTGFKVNVMEVNGTAQTANDNGADINTLIDRITAARAGFLDNLNGHIAQTGDSFTIVNDGTHGNAALETLVDEIETILKHVTYGNSALQVLLADRPTVAQFNARTLLAANYFEFGVDNVIVGTNNDKTGYALSNVGADLILKTATFALAMADAIWDEVLTGATHNVATSAGRRLRQISGIAIYNETAVGGTANTITLDAGASAINGIYNRNLIVIVGGLGAGQTRTITEYAGGTQVATVARVWNTNPDNTSEFQIIGRDNIGHPNHGYALAGAAGTIQLEAGASAVDDIYNDMYVIITSGTGWGQARLITDYDGGTTTAIVTPNWVVNPDNTSVYHVVFDARKTIDTAVVADAVWDELEAGHVLAGSFGQEVTQQGKKLDRNFVWGLP